MLGRRTMWPTPCSEAVSHSSRTRSIFREAAHQTRSVSVPVSNLGLAHDSESVRNRREGKIGPDDSDFQAEFRSTCPPDRWEISWFFNPPSLSIPFHPDLSSSPKRLSPGWAKSGGERRWPPPGAGKGGGRLYLLRPRRNGRRLPGGHPVPVLHLPVGLSPTRRPFSTLYLLLLLSARAELLRPRL
jgi:hypothetical protein